jgi:hypothetical protein
MFIDALFYHTTPLKNPSKEASTWVPGSFPIQVKTLLLG